MFHSKLRRNICTHGALEDFLSEALLLVFTIALLCFISGRAVTNSKANCARITKPSTLFFFPLFRRRTLHFCGMISSLP
jgi:hypothetical protein